MADIIATVKNIGVYPLLGLAVVLLGLVAAFTTGEGGDDPKNKGSGGGTQ